MKELERRLFVDNGEEHGTVILNWVGTPDREFTWYGEAFHQAAKSLVDQLRNDPRFGLYGPPPDSFKAVPIVYMYRHAMELCLKGIVLAGADILLLRGKPEVDFKRLLTVHNLREVLRSVERIFEAFGRNWDFSLPRFRTLGDFRAAVDELDSVDAQSFAFCYPTQKDGRTASLESHFRFNLFDFCNALDPLFPLLDGAAFSAYVGLEDEYEDRAYARQSDLENANYE